MGRIAQRTLRCPVRGQFYLMTRVRSPAAGSDAAGERHANLVRLGLRQSESLRHFVSL